MKSAVRHRRATPGALLAAWSRLGMAMDDLVPGKSRADIAANIATEIRAGKDPKQAAAIAYSVAGKDAGADLDALIARWNDFRGSVEQSPSDPQEEVSPVAANPVSSTEAPESAAAPAIAAGILYLNAGRVLLLMRSAGATDYPNTWGFPAGHLDPGESPLLAALREAKEEVGSAPESADLLSNENGFALFLARGDATFQPTLNDESAGYVWADPDVLPQPLHPGVEEAIRAVLPGSGMDEADIAQAIELADAWAADGTARALDTNGWFEVKDNPLSKVGIFPYRGRALPGAADPDKTYRVYRPADELGDPETVDSFKLLPWIDNHPPGLLGREEDGLTRPESKGVQGVTGEDVRFDPDAFEHGGLFGNIKLFSSAMADQIQAGKKQLSAGFRCTYDWTPGKFNGHPYDCVQRNIRGNHLASVKQGRMGPDVAVLDHGDIVIDSLPERNIMADTSTNAPEGGASSGMSLEEAREKFNEVVQQIDTILQALPALKQALEPSNPDDSNPDVPIAADARGKDADDTGPFADPEGKKYPLRNDEEIRAAWDYIHVKKDGDEYSPEQRKQIEDRIVAAWKDKIDKSGPPEAQVKDADIKPIEKKETAMDEAEMFRGFERKMASRNKLVDQLSKHVGTFDATGMDEADVASYGCLKLGLKAPKGQEMAYLNGFLAASKAPTAVPAKAMDSGDGGWLNKQRASYNV